MINQSMGKTLAPERVINGMKVDYIEKRYKAKYVGLYSLPTSDGPYLIFYTETPDKEAGHDNYFGIWRNPLDGDDVRIVNAKSIRDAEFSAIEVAPGEFLVSRWVHDMVSHPSGAWLDGGPFYTRCDSEHPPTHVMKVVDGKEVFRSSRIDPKDELHLRFALDVSGNGMAGVMYDVGEFHLAADQPVRYVPKIPSQAEIDFRIRLIDEEFTEFKDACAAGDIVEVADALTDLMYVIAGAAHHFGVALDHCWSEVHMSNMTKVDPTTGKVTKRSDGKVLKPASFRPPNIPRALGLEEAA